MPVAADEKGEITVDEANENLQDSELKAILFRVNDQLMGIRIDYVREVLEYRDPTPVPDSPVWIAGVLDVGDRILPVTSLHQCLYGNDQSGDGEGHLLSVNVQGREVAFTTDVVTAIRTLESDEVTPPTELTSRIHDSLIEGITRIDEEVVVLIDPEKIVDPEVMGEVLKSITDEAG